MSLPTTPKSRTALLAAALVAALLTPAVGIGLEVGKDAVPDSLPAPADEVSPEAVPAGPVPAGPVVQDSIFGEPLFAEPVPPDSVTARPDSADSISVVRSPADSTWSQPPPVAAAFSGKSVRREGDDLMSLATTTPAEAFAFEPGIGLFQLGSPGLPQAMRLRASRPRDVMYLLDGYPITDSRIETFDINWLPLAGMAGAEITLDGQSGRYGSGATAGVMNLTSLGAMPAVPISDIVAWWGSFDSRAVNFRFNRRITHKCGILLAYENLHSGGWVGSSSANSNKFYGKLAGYIGRQWTYDIVGYRYDGSIELPDSCPDTSDLNSVDRDDKRDFVGVSVTGGTDRTVRLSYSYLGAGRDYASRLTYGSSEWSLHDFSLLTTWVNPDSLAASLGAGIKRYRIRSGSGRVSEPNGIYASVAAGKRLRAWRLEGSLRVERSSEGGVEVGGDLDASLRALPWCLVFGRIDRSYAYPNFKAIRLSSEFGGSDEDSEHWNSVELGTELETRPVELKAAVFLRMVDNSTVLAGNDDCMLVRLEGKDLTYMGGEVLLGWKRPPWLSASLGYSLARARDKNGNAVTYVPSGSFTWDLRMSREFSGHISAGATFAGRWVSVAKVGNRPEPCSETGCLIDARLDGYVAALLYGYIEIDSGRVYGRVRNLFNQTIVEDWGRLELPPRSFELGINLKLYD